MSVPDSRVMLTVRMAGSGELKSASVSDPGNDHGENMPAWETLGVYLAYDNGEVLCYELSREAYEDSVRQCATAGFDHHVTFSAFEGNMTVYAVAFGAGQTFQVVDGLDELRNLTTASLEDLQDAAARNTYMKSLFSGKSAEVQVSHETSTHIDVTLQRLAAKVDVQYDVQDAYEQGGYTQATMSAITFKGWPQGFFFLDEATALSPTLDFDQQADGTVSERNGRAVFYTFPGAQNEFGFTIDYTFDGTEGRWNDPVNYTARFKNALAPDTWHYVRFTVRGTQAAATGIELGN